MEEGHEHELERTEVEAVLETRRELGPSYDRALVDSFTDRIEAAVVARTAQEAEVRRDRSRARSAEGQRQLALGIVASAVGIPVTAMSLVIPESDGASLAALLIAWGGLVGINVAHAVQSRRGA